MQALEARKTAKLKRVYYDLEDMIKTNKDGQTPYTPVLPLLYGMQASMNLLKAEGFENVKIVCEVHLFFVTAFASHKR